MASSAPLPDPAAAAFNKAIREFRTGLKNEALYSKILATTSADQVYDLTDALQKDQSKGGHLRNLAKLQPYLNRLEGYCGAIDTFVQAKPEILALIWGPIKLLLQWASTLTKSLDALINTAGEIGRLLPEFRISVQMFGFNDLLALFFQDMLDFYLIALKFFSMPKFQTFFEALWPKRKQKIEGVIDRITRHTTMLRNDVRLEHIQEEYNHRARAMEHFENLEQTTRRTDYGVFERNVAPIFYDAKLDNLRGQLCEGTGSWLLSDTHMRQWLEATEDSPKVIWLRGIPGAGKTFLAACVVGELRSKTSSSKVIFAFLSHAFRDTTSALSVLHSLIFQLTRDDTSLQDVVCEISRGALCSDLAAATDVLIKLLACSGRVHIVIDGLDEVDEGERRRLLLEMLQVSERSSETRILVGCRAEHDLKDLLQPASTEIRVDTRNMDGIQAYVTDYYSRWFRSHDFDQEEKKDFIALFSPIAGRAKGMFMYARLILKGLEFFNTIDEVRDELRVLPKDLDDAYGRILSRVNEKLPSNAVRDKARRILGWVGCSPMPMTIQELEQALSIRIGDYDQVPNRYSTLNLVLLCGPVVEVVDDEVQFVHFTAKQYFFSHEVANSLDISQYTLSLAKSCITYLCQAHHDPDIDKSQFETYFVNGVYRLHYYAMGTWLRLIELYSRSNGIDEDASDFSLLLDLLRCVLDRRDNTVYIPDDVEAEFPGLKSFKDAPLEVYNLLCREMRFRQKSESSLFKLGTGDWDKSDPLTLRRITASVHKALDEMAGVPTEHEAHTQHAKQCHCDAIQRNYGTRPFKCPFVGCLYHRIGFETKDLRRAHCRDHDRPWRCDVPTCEYTEIGFLSRRMRDDHLDRFHKAEDPGPLLESSLTNSDQQVAFLLSLIRADKVKSVQSLLVPAQDLDNGRIRALLDEVVSSGSFNMIETVGMHLWGRLQPFRYPDNQDYYPQSLLMAVTAGNAATLKWLATKARDKGILDKFAAQYQMLCDVLGILLKSDKSAALYSHFGDIAISFRDPINNLGNSRPSGWFMGSTIISATSGRPQSEGTLISFWRKLNDAEPIHNSHLYHGLQSVARTTRSITLASVLIDLGADLNCSHRKGLLSPLLIAAQQDSNKAANFLRFLLYRGANPEIEHTRGRYISTPSGHAYVTRTRKICEEAGAKGISKWLNKSWEELVAEATEARKNNDNPPIPED